MSAQTFQLDPSLANLPPALLKKRYDQMTPEERRAAGFVRPATDAEIAAAQTPTGAPTDFAGPVLPNPHNIKVSDDTDSGVEPTRLPNGVSFQQQNFTGATPGDISNPPHTQMSTTGAQFGAQPVTLDMSTAQPLPAPVKLDMSTAQPIASGGAKAEPPGFWDTLQREGKALTGSIAGVPAAVYHAFSDPATQEEKDKFGGEDQVTGAKRIGLGVHRLTTAPIENAVNWYSDVAKGKIQSPYEQALSVAPEAIGSAAGNVIGGKLVEAAPAITKGAVDLGKAAAATETGSKLVQSAKVLGQSAEELPVVGKFVKAGQKLGELKDIWNPADATKENVPYAGEEDAAPRTVITDPATGKPEFSDVVAAKQNATQATPAAPAATPAKVEQALNESLGGQPLVRGVSLRNQPAAQAAAAGKLPAGFTPVDSTVLKGYKYDPQAQEFTAITNNGQSYTHGEVTPEQVAAFENADSQGSAWTKFIRNNNVLVKKNGVPVTPGTMGSESGNIMPKSRSGMNEPETETYSQPLQQMLDEALQDKNTAPTGKSGSILNRLVKGEAGQAGSPGSVTDADEGIADIQSRPVLATKTGQVPARGYLNMVGADENSVLKTPADLDSVFYHRQQIAQNGTPNVELHVDEAGNIIGAQGRHRAIAAIQQGGPSSKVNVTIYKHPFQASE